MANKPVRAEVVVRDNNIEQAIRKLRKIAKKEGYLEVLKEKEFYKKPSQIKHEKDIRIKRKRKKELDKMILEEKRNGV